MRTKKLFSQVFKRSQGIILFLFLFQLPNAEALVSGILSACRAAIAAATGSAREPAHKNSGLPRKFEVTPTIENKMGALLNAKAGDAFHLSIPGTPYLDKGEIKYAPKRVASAIVHSVDKKNGYLYLENPSNPDFPQRISFEDVIHSAPASNRILGNKSEAFVEGVDYRVGVGEAAGQAQFTDAGGLKLLRLIPSINPGKLPLAGMHADIKMKDGTLLSGGTYSHFDLAKNAFVFIGPNGKAYSLAPHQIASFEAAKLRGPEGESFEIGHHVIEVKPGIYQMSSGFDYTPQSGKMNSRQLEILKMKTGSPVSWRVAAQGESPKIIDGTYLGFDKEGKLHIKVGLAEKTVDPQDLKPRSFPDPLNALFQEQLPAAFDRHNRTTQSGIALVLKNGQRVNVERFEKINRVGNDLQIALKPEQGKVQDAASRIAVIPVSQIDPYMTLALNGPSFYGDINTPFGGFLRQMGQRASSSDVHERRITVKNKDETLTGNVVGLVDDMVRIRLPNGQLRNIDPRFVQVLYFDP